MSQSSTNPFWQLIIYVDSNPVPQHVTIEVPRTIGELTAMVSDATACTGILSVMYWDPEQQSYLPLSTLSPVIKFHGRAQLWVQSDGMRLELVDRTADDAEYRQLRRHVATLNSEHIVYHLTEAHRVVFPRLEGQFLQRVHQLLEPATAMLWYTGNANSSSDAVQQGFALPRGGGGITFVSSLSDPNSTTPPATPQKILLCEVAVGRTASQTRPPHPSVADSVVSVKGGVHRTFTVFNPLQALPRYILTVKGTTATEAPSASRKSTPKNEVPRESFEKPPRSAQATPTSSPGGRSRVAATSQASFLSRQDTTPRSVTPTTVEEFRCATHKEELTTLWCSTCGHLVCPYCLSVGHHRGHDGRELDEVVARTRSTLIEANTTITERRDSAQRMATVLHSSKREMDETKAQGEQRVRTSIGELESLLETKKHELLEDIRCKASAADGHVAALQQYFTQCDQRRREFEELLMSSQETSREGKMRFLKGVQGPLAEWHNKPLPTPPLFNVPPASALVGTHINTHPCQVAIRQLSLQKQPGQHSPNEPHHEPEAASRDARLVVSLQHQLASQRAQLDDLTRGYIWNIPQAEKMFHVDQRKDIFSDVFYLRGVAWELRIASEAVSSPRPQDASTSSAELQDHLSVYLHSVNHHHRIDYRVSLFGPGGWHVREAKGWTAEFAGKGWGIRPFCSRKMLLREFVHDGLVKVCVVPIDGLY